MLMSKKQKALSAVAISFCAILVGAGIGFYTVVTPDSADSLATEVKAETSNNSDGGRVGTLSPPGSDTISLEPKSNSGSSGGLSVNDSPSLSANLGSGSTANLSTGSNSTANNTSNNSFKEYEQYKDKDQAMFGEIQEGNGAVARKDSQLAVTYVGYLTNGEIFDQSRPGNNGQLQPLLFTLGGGQLIPGFEQGVTGMKAGGKRRIIIPPSLGYGDKAQGNIPANSVLIFDVELTAVQ